MKVSIISIITRLAALGLLLALFSRCATNPVTGRNQFALISENQEIAMGQQYDPSIVSEFGLYPDDKLQRYIEEKGQSMAAISHRAQLNFQFRLLDSPVINAFAVPGGFVYFTRGIMAHFNNEAQFMGVLGHEIGHITARHSVSQMSKQTLAQVGLIAGMIAVPQLAQLGDLAGTGLQLLFMKFSRDDESQSDQLGVEYSSRVGYDAHEMAGFFETIRRTQESAGVSIPTFLSTHPDPVDRNQRVHQLADEWQSKLNLNRRDLKVGRDSYLRMIDGIVYGEDPRQGFFEGNAYYHPELKFQFPVPAGWQKQNTPSQVIMANQDQSAAILLQLAQGRTPREAAQALVDQYKIQVVESNDINVNGLPAFYFVGDIVGEQGQQATRALVFEIPYNNLIYQFIGFSDRLVFSNHQNTFLHTMRGFNQLTDTSKLNVQPERVAIKELNRAMTFAEAMRQYNMPANRLEELAVLNGMQLEDRLPAGTLIKTVSK